jgi:hypothetical protein
MLEHSVKIVGVPGVEALPMAGPDGASMKPFDLPATHIFKVPGEIEAMGFVIAYNSKTGWE